MGRYKFYDIDEVEIYDIDDNTFKLLEDVGSIESEIIERSFTSGAIFPGIQRDESKELTFSFQLNRGDENDFRDYFNEFIHYARNARFLRDTTNSIQTEILLVEKAASFEDGGWNKGAGITVSFSQLTPYWQDIAYIETTALAQTNYQAVISNAGWVSTPPIITLTANTIINEFYVKRVEGNKGIFIKDLQFGNLGLTEYVLDFGAGTAKLGGIDRANLIRKSTGWFDLLVGNNTIQIVTSASCDILIQLKRRFYI